MRSITVIKVGGSLASSGAAVQLLRALAAQSRSDLVIVPGGGVFADAVRAAQSVQRFSDAAAHHMALLAMHAMALALIDLAPGFAPAESPGQFAAAWETGSIPVWLPSAMVLAASDVPSSWDVTSDSLAAWLAGKIGAQRLLLVKSCSLPENARSLPALMQAGVVDACFGHFVAGRGFSWQVLSGVEAALRALAELEPPS